MSIFLGVRVTPVRDLYYTRALHCKAMEIPSMSQLLLPSVGMFPGLFGC